MQIERSEAYPSVAVPLEPLLAFLFSGLNLIAYTALLAQHYFRESVMP